MALTVKATVYGQEYTLVYNSSTGKYEAEVTAPSASSYQYNSGHYFPVSIAATDEAGNKTTISDTAGGFTDKLKLFAKEQVKPTISALSPSNGSNLTTSNPSFEFNVLDNSNGQTTGFSGINPDSIVLVVCGKTVSGSEITKTAITGGYKCKYTPKTAIADGSWSYSVKASDYDGNESATASASFKVDTAPPLLEITSPADNDYTNQNTLTVTGVTSDATSSPVTVKIKVGNVDQGSVTVGSDGSFSKVVTLSEGSNVITVTSTDSVGKVSTATRTVILKTSGPVFKTVEISPNPVNCGKTYTISVTFEA